MRIGETEPPCGGPPESNVSELHRRATAFRAAVRRRVALLSCPLASWTVRLRALESLCTPALLWCCEAFTWNIDELRHVDLVYVWSMWRMLRLPTCAE